MRSSRISSPLHPADRFSNRFQRSRPGPDRSDFRNGCRLVTWRAARSRRGGAERQHAGETRRRLRRDRRLRHHRPAGRDLYRLGHDERIQDLSADRRRAVRERALGAAHDRAGGRSARGNDRRDRRVGTCADDQRRALGPDHAAAAAGHLPQGAGLCGHAAAAAGSGRHAEPRGARLEQPRRPQHQRRPQQHHQPDLRRGHQPGHRLEHGTLPRAQVSTRSPRSRC